MPVTLISPHLDDAAFSLGLTTTRLWEIDSRLTIINCYTVTQYAPYSTETSISAVSKVRMSEDIVFVEQIPFVVVVYNLSRLDAPLRLGINDVCSERDFDRVDHSEADALSAELSPLIGSEALFVPLALGNHIDHRIARNATLMVRAQGLIGFFEDLPYAAHCTSEHIRATVREIEIAINAKLYPVILRCPDALARKRRIVEVYKSQIAEPEITSILIHAHTYGGGERMWVNSDLLKALGPLL